MKWHNVLFFVQVPHCSKHPVPAFSQSRQDAEDRLQCNLNAENNGIDVSLRPRPMQLETVLTIAFFHILFAWGFFLHIRI